MICPPRAAVKLVAAIVGVPDRPPTCGARRHDTPEMERSDISGGGAGRRMDGTPTIAAVRLKPDTTYAFLSSAERRVYYPREPRTA